MTSPSASPAGSSTPLPASLRPLIFDILAKSDLESVTPRALRSDLISIQNSQKFSSPADVTKLIPSDFDFDANKKVVSALIKQCYDQVVERAADATQEAIATATVTAAPQPVASPPAMVTTNSTKPPAASNGPWSGGLALPGMGGIRGSHQSPTAVDLKDSSPASLSASQSASQASQSTADAALATKLQRQWSEAGPSTRGSTSGSTAKSKKASKKRKASAVADPDAIESEEDSDLDSSFAPANGAGGSSGSSNSSNSGPKKKPKGSNGATSSRASNPNNPFNRPVVLSPLMADICGGDEMPRHGVVKQLWAYIKGRDLQNPTNKRQIKCDEKLAKLFGKSTVDSFEMSKLIGNHIKKKEEIVG